jgi:Zn-dependent protease with chaperone function
MTLLEMERHPVFRRAVLRRNLYLALLVVCELALLGLLACLRISTQEGEVPVLGFFISFKVLSWGTLVRLLAFIGALVGFVHWSFIQAFRGKGMIHLEPIDRSNGQRFGGMTGPELVAMVQELARTLGVGRIDHIAVTRQADPNAYTARILGLGNVVVLHSNLLDILPRQGVRSVIAHEVGHIRRKDSVLYQFLSVPRTVAWIIVLLSFARMVGGTLDSENPGEFLGRLGFLALALLVVTQVFDRLQRLANLASQQTELMVDGYAALVCGWDNHLNALLLVGERAEALSAFLKALHKVVGWTGEELNEKSVLRLLNLLPPGELDAERAGDSAAGLYIIDRLTRLRERLLVPLSDQEIGDLAARAVASLRKNTPRDEDLEPEEAEKEHQKEEAELQERERILREKLVFWRDYDRDRSGFLDRHELARLVEDLRRDPDRMIFREFLESDAQWKDHPTTRHRVLFLADLFEAEKVPLG